MFVRLGAYDFTDDASATGEDHDIEHFKIHPQYDRQVKLVINTPTHTWIWAQLSNQIKFDKFRYTHKNDIAVLKMKTKAQFTHFIRPVCLPPKRRSYVNELATVVGWGSTDFGKTIVN